MSELDDAIAGMRIRAPSERNRSLTRLLAAASPRLTRLRTAACETCWRSAISR